MRTSAAVIIIATARCSKDFIVRRRGRISRAFLGAPLHALHDTISSQVCRTGSYIGSGPRCSNNENLLRHLTLTLLNLGGMRHRLALLALMALRFLLLLFAAAAAATSRSLPHQRREPYLQHFNLRLLEIPMSIPIMKLPGDTPLYVGHM